MGVGNLICFVISDLIYGDFPPFSVGVPMPTVLNLFPVFSLVRGTASVSVGLTADSRS